MPADNPETGVKDGSEVSPTPETQTKTVEPPAVENTVQPKTENHGNIPYPRFQEVNLKMRSLEAELAKYKAEKLAESQAVTSATDDKELTEEDIMSKYQSRLQEAGISDPKTSKMLSQVIKDIAKQEAKERYAKEANRSAASQAAQVASEKARVEASQKDIAEWQSELKKAHEDYAEIEPIMLDKWSKLDPAAKMAVVASKQAHELLFEAARASKLSEVRAKGEEDGRSAAYETKSLKTALSSLPGSAPKPGKKFTAEDVGDMSAEFYTANKEQILKDLAMK